MVFALEIPKELPLPMVFVPEVTPFSVTKFLWKRFPFTYPDGFTMVVAGSGRDVLNDEKEIKIFLEILKEVFPKERIEGNIDDIKIENETKMEKETKTHFIFITKSPNYFDIVKFQNVKYRVFIANELKMIPRNVLSESSMIVIKDLVEYMKVVFASIVANIPIKNGVFFVADRTCSVPSFHGIYIL